MYLKGKIKSCFLCFTSIDFEKKFDIIVKNKKGVVNMEEKTLIFGHKNPDTDSICSSIVMEDFERKLGNDNCKAVRIGNVNKETKYVLDYLGMEEIPYVEDVEDGTNVILVDHNEATQCVNNIQNAKILKVIDHHTMNFKAPYLLYYRAEPVGCTATVLYHLYTENNFEIEKNIAILMMSSIISDTLLFKSPTCTPEDEKVARELAKIAGIDIEAYGLEMLKAGTDLDDFSEEELINLDAKKFTSGDLNYIIAQVNTVSIQDVLKKKEKIEERINAVIEKEGLNLFVFAITDILNSNSQIIALGNRTDIIEKTCKLEDNMAFLEGVVSRKKQLVPLVENNI